MLVLKDFRVTDSLGLKDFRVKGVWRSHDLGVKPSSACNELRMRQRDPMQWIRLQRILRPAMNYGCGSAIVCNELRLLIRHRAVRKNTHAGLQRIPSAGWPSCDQKRHTRWHATNSGWWCGHTRWHATNSGWCCALVPSETCQRMLGFKEFRVKQN